MHIKLRAHFRVFFKYFCSPLSKWNTIFQKYFFFQGRRVVVGTLPFSYCLIHPHESYQFDMPGFSANKQQINFVVIWFGLLYQKCSPKTMLTLIFPVDKCDIFYLDSYPIIKNRGMFGQRPSELTSSVTAFFKGLGESYRSEIL